MFVRTRVVILVDLDSAIVAINNFAVDKKFRASREAVGRGQLFDARQHGVHVLNKLQTHALLHNFLQLSLIFG